ncbi:uncharacterized protein LOC106868490 [Octopus bimaculoides]|uniref:uncharacterized protein LOC106868490 n=1 Tax=Octopus bimaculoides TaxID=37653 RepID=UPI00071DBFB1|nr:uncharacterized protein LOC106868490 [Octopus bimaculoides]|eukprot:XP_014769279.1 PREDICTED: uncharacterized protein LOC106868490 [Octopus bimaculoides]
MVIDGNTIIILHKGGESNTATAKMLKINRMTVWKIVKKFQENGSNAGRLGRGRKKSVLTPQLIKSAREKIRRNPRCSVRKLAVTVKISRRSMCRVLKERLGSQPYKMIHRHELMQVYKAMRQEESRLILRQIAKGTLSDLLFTDEKNEQRTVNYQNDRLWSISSSVESRLVN